MVSVFQLATQKIQLRKALYEIPIKFFKSDSRSSHKSRLVFLVCIYTKKNKHNRILSDSTFRDMTSATKQMWIDGVTPWGQHKSQDGTLNMTKHYFAYLLVLHFGIYDLNRDI